MARKPRALTSEEVAEAAGADVESTRRALRVVRFTDETDDSTE